MNNRTKEYYRELSLVQNCEVNANQDIMTITGFMSWDEKQKHLQRYKTRAIDAGQYSETEN